MNAAPKPARLSLAALAAGAALAATAPGAGRADVTIEEQATFNLTIIKAHSTTTELTTADKQRRDTQFHCEGFMSLLCGNTDSGEIIRLDRDLQWQLEPKKQEYRETLFLTPAQRQEMQRRAQAMIEQMKQCPVNPQSTAPAPNTQKCEMTPPKFDSKQTDTHAMFAGHDSRLSQLSLTQSCRNNETGDVCDFVISMDAWLTQDQIAGLDDRGAFQKAYRHKLGLDDSNTLVAQQMRQFLAPYADSLKQLGAKASDFKGYPLKSSVRIGFGGEHCAAAKGQQQGAAAGGSGTVVADAGQAAGTAAAGTAAGQAGSAAGAAAGNAAGSNAAGSILSSAASTFGSKLVGGLFSKKKTDAAPPNANTAAASASLPPGMVQAVEFSVETKSITAGAVPAAQFEIPAGWKLVVPKTKPEKEFSCPKT
jgi:hypothetical protein